MHVSGWKCVIFVYKTPCWSIIWPVTLSSEMIFWMKGLPGKLNWTSVLSNSDTSSCINPPTLYSSIGFLRKGIVYFAEYFNIFETFFFLLDIYSFLFRLVRKWAFRVKWRSLFSCEMLLLEISLRSAANSHTTHTMGKGVKRFYLRNGRGQLPFWRKNKTQYQRLSKFNAFGISWFWKMIIEIIGEGYKWFIENSYRQLSQKNAVSTPNQITAAEEYQDHENCPFEEETSQELRMLSRSLSVY